PRRSTARASYANWAGETTAVVSGPRARQGPSGLAAVHPAISGSGSGRGNATATNPAPDRVTNAGAVGGPPRNVIAPSAARRPHVRPVQNRHGPVVARANSTRATYPFPAAAPYTYTVRSTRTAPVPHEIPA